MHQEPPDIETCKRIINSTKLRTERSIVGSIVSIALAGVLTWLALFRGNVLVINGTYYLNILAIWLLTGVACCLSLAYRDFIVKKQDRALLWLAKDYLFRQIAADIAQNAKQGADGKTHEASQPPR